ncbi:hypothetical protein [Streptomyces albidus (ex Kaewkla and Franco 2022)]|uniref:hypothetical protein n=1 Tax=Streptomyces albidus (ex Kaewkla and Franco 2022) TaxID=722709 RepID=UPI001F3295AD|nr:hypothetical protein [Streptomyces albidus (ex Kaewkla and Franco 2022)]
MPEAARAPRIASAPAPAPDAPARYAWVAPLVSTLLTVPAAVLALFFVGISQMACDGCGEPDQNRFDASFETAFAVFVYCLAAPAVLLVLSWLLPWQHRYAARRLVFALAAFFAVPFLYSLFLGLVDWPA